DGANPLLALRRLSTRFEVGNEVYKAVNEVDLSLEAEECLGIVGESGSGKSVTAMSILGLVPTPAGKITGGQVMYGGEDLLDAPLARLRAVRGGDIACVFQDPLSTLHPLFTVGDQLIEAIRAHQPLSPAAARMRGAELLELVQIPGAAQRLDASPHPLPGGLPHRGCTALPLADAPGDMLAAERTTAPDVTVQARVRGLMARLRRDRKAAVLFISHDCGVVSEICDPVAVMYAGRV